MTAQQYLEGIERAERKIEVINRRLEELRTRAEGVGAIRYDKDRVQTSPQNTMPDAVIKLCEIEDKYREAVIRAEVYKHEAQRRVNALADARYIAILTARYVDRLTWEGVGERTSYSPDHAIRLHREALRAFSEANRDIIGGYDETDRRGPADGEAGGSERDGNAGRAGAEETDH